MIFWAFSSFFVSFRASYAWIALAALLTFAYYALGQFKLSSGLMAICVLKTKANSPVPQWGLLLVSCWTRWSQGHCHYTLELFTFLI
jgi:hypothetical protein